MNDSFVEHGSNSTPLYAQTAERPWQQAPSSDEIPLRTIWSQLTDSTQIYSLIFTSVVVFLACACILLATKPSFIYYKEKVSTRKVLTLSFILSLIVVGINIYIYKYK